MEKNYPVLGHSMRFLLEPGDEAAALPCRPAELRAGDIALLVKWKAGRPAGYIIHRVLFNGGLDGRRFLLTKGDANFLPDLPPSAFQPVARITAVSRAGRAWSARPGPAWPLAAAYSFAANKLISWAVHFVFFLFSAAVLCLPRFFSAPLNALYLWWEARLYPGVLRLVSSVMRPSGHGRPAPAAGGVKSGRITADETWAGKITAADYLIIEPGVRITVRPGTEINFTRREPWFFPVLRAGTDGTRRELDSSSAKILVYGSFAASGTADSPVVFGGGSFGGLHALGQGEIELRDCRLENCAACALTVRDGASAGLERCTFASCRGGTEASGFSSIFLKDCLFSDPGGPALRLLDDSLSSAYGCEVRDGAGPAVESGGRATAALRSFSAEGCASGVEASGSSSLRLEECRFERNAGHALMLRGAARLEAAGCDVSGNAAGLSARGKNSFRLRSCSFSGSRGPSIELYGSNSVEALDCSFSGGESGIEGEGRNSVKLTACSFGSIRGRGVDLARAAAFRAKSCDFNACGTGIRLTDRRSSAPGSDSGRNPLELSSCSFRAIRGHGLDLKRVAGFRAKSCDLSDCEAGIRLTDCRASALEDISISGGRGPGLYARGAGSLKADRISFKANAIGADIGGACRSELNAAVFKDQYGPAAVFSGRASALITASSFSGNISGLYAGGYTSLDLRGCAFRDNGGPSLEIAGRSSLSLRETTSAGSPAALALSELACASLDRFDARSCSAPAVSLSGGASLRGRDCSFYSETDAVYAEGSGALEFRSCSAVSASGAALKLGIKRAELESVRAEGAGGLNLRAGGVVAARGLKIKARDYAVESAADGFFAQGLEARGGARGGVLVSSGRTVIRGAVLDASPYPGLAAAAGASLKAVGVHFEGKPWAPPPRRAHTRRLLFRFASATAGLPGFGPLYRLVYLAAVPAARALLSGPGVSSLYLYRGMASAGWVPALSDMDLACALDRSSPENDWAAYSRLKVRLRLLKALFPFTGEVLCAGKRQLQAFIAEWGVKGEEFRASSRLLAGRPMDLWPLRTPCGKVSPTAADDTEAFYSYTLLLHHLFSEDLPPGFRRRNCLKGLVDIKRYLDRDAADRVSRRDYAARAGLPLEHYSSVPELQSAFEAFRALHSAAGNSAPPAGDTLPQGVPAGASGFTPSSGFNRHAFEAACSALEADCGARLGVVLDALYRVYVILPDSAAADEVSFSSVVAAMRRTRLTSPFLSAAPLLLTGASFGFLSRLPYLNNPLFPLDVSRGGGETGVHVYNLPAPPGLPPAETTRAGAALAARHFSASWRSLWEAMPPHYFYTRAAGLRLLLEKGAAPPFSDPDGVGDAFRGNYGGSAPSWETYSAGGTCRENYLFVSAQAEALTELADGKMTADLTV